MSCGKSQLGGEKSQLSSGKRQLGSGKGQLDGGKNQLSSGKSKLGNGKNQLISSVDKEQLRDAMLLYAVTDEAWLRGRTLVDCVRQAIEGGATFVQLREKEASHEDIVHLAREIGPLCRIAGVPFVIDDDVEAALESGADGVHVGQDDAACADARRTLGPDAIVGVSAQTVEQALKAQVDGADYLGVGALIPTPTKPDAVDVTYEELRAICDAVDIPVVGIGGLNATTIEQLAGSGADGAAVVSAIFAADDCLQATRDLRAVCERTFKR